MAIRQFACKETEKLWNEKRSRIARDIQERAMIKLAVLDACSDINDLRIPKSNHLEALKGERKGQHSIRINSQWRICFIFDNGNAYDVAIVDYH